MYERTAETMLKLAEEVGSSRLPPRIKAIIVAAFFFAAFEASRNANRYRRAAMAAQTAHENLCFGRGRSIQPPAH